MIIDKQELESYKYLTKSIIDDVIDNLQIQLPEFSPYAIMTDRNGRCIAISLEKYKYDTTTMINMVKEIQDKYDNIVVGITVVSESWIPKLDQDDPKLLELEAGILDLDSIPFNKRVSTIHIWSECLGAYRKALLLPLNEERKLLFEGIAEIDARNFGENFLIKQNNWRN